VYTQLERSFLYCIVKLKLRQIEGTYFKSEGVSDVSDTENKKDLNTEWLRRLGLFEENR